MVDYKYITLSELIAGYQYPDDSYNIASYLSEARLKAFAHNPNLKGANHTTHAISVIDNKVCGGLMLFESSFYNGVTIERAQCMSALETVEQYREEGIGAGLFCYAAAKTEPKYVICSGISDLALPLYKMMRFKMLTFPRMLYLNDSAPIVYSILGKNLLGTLARYCLNALCFPIRFKNNYRRKSILRRFSIINEKKVPAWVEDLTLRDSKKYKEVHDKNWLQWNLDYNFQGEPSNKQSFYTIFENENPIGFFMTKERYREEAGGKLRDFVLGAIVEWGTYDEKKLSECDIYILALSTFTKNVGIIEIASTNPNTVSTMKSYGFLKHGVARVALRDKTKQLKDSDNIDNWRLRLGYADVILSK